MQRWVKKKGVPPFMMYKIKIIHVLPPNCWSCKLLPFSDTIYLPQTLNFISRFYCYQHTIFVLCTKYSFRYDARLNEAKKLGTRKGFWLGITGGLAAFFLMCTIAVAFWYDKSTCNYNLVKIATFCCSM